jgi:hypothetical protein
MSNPVAKSQRTAVAGTGETTIVTADPNFNLNLYGLIITTPNAAAGTLTLRDSTAGVVRAVFDYPNGAAAPGAPLVIPFNPPLQQSLLNNNNWTLQASVNAAGYNVTALFNEA